ncbi:MAG: response regulator transcription factor [Proteobacteria bacterium]|nr:response regulator transcription factor [Pseudomonadota bacterium]
MDKYRIVLADDHPLLRQGLKKIIHENGGMKVIGEAGDGMELLKLLPKTNPDLVIMDISMPKLRGIEAIPRIKTIHPQVKVLILSMHGDKAYLTQAIAAGADGYLLKEDADSELFTAIETIFQNKIYISPMLADLTREDWVDRCRQKDKPFTKKTMTPREREIIKLIADGKTSKEIADLLFISYRTVERHRANIMRKFGLKKTADLVKFAIEKGYV